MRWLWRLAETPSMSNFSSFQAGGETIRISKNIHVMWICARPWPCMRSLRPCFIGSWIPFIFWENVFWPCPCLSLKLPVPFLNIIESWLRPARNSRLAVAVMLLLEATVIRQISSINSAISDVFNLARLPSWWIWGIIHYHQEFHGETYNSSWGRRREQTKKRTALTNRE